MRNWPPTCGCWSRRASRSSSPARPTDRVARRFSARCWRSCRTTLASFTWTRPHERFEWLPQATELGWPGVASVPADGDPARPSNAVLLVDDLAPGSATASVGCRGEGGRPSRQHRLRTGHDSRRGLARRGLRQAAATAGRTGRRRAVAPRGRPGRWPERGGAAARDRGALRAPGRPRPARPPPATRPGGPRDVGPGHRRIRAFRVGDQPGAGPSDRPSGGRLRDRGGSTPRSPRRPRDDRPDGHGRSPRRDSADTSRPRPFDAPGRGT